jgi:DNA-binding GntR family transcriptional regulator
MVNLGGVQRSRSLALQVHTALLDLVRKGALQPGERVVIERLAELLGVSQTPVRESVARLAQEGLVVEGASGRLYMVALSEPYVRDVFWVRGALEGLCAEVATPLLSRADQDDLEAQLAATHAAFAQDDYGPYMQSDARLHELLITRTPNAMLRKELLSLQPHVELIRSYSQRTNGAHLRASHQEHVQICAAFRAGDAALARMRTEQHIRHAGERIIKLIDF